MLEKPYFVSARHRNYVESKKSRIPLERVFMGPRSKAFVDANSFERSLIIEDSETINSIIDGRINSMIVPMHDEPPKDDRDISRFLGKMALEALAHKFQNDLGWIDEITDKLELDALRNYVRLGDKPDMWQYNQRRIYPERLCSIIPKYHLNPTKSCMNSTFYTQ